MAIPEISVKVGANALAKYGENFGKMGVYVKNPGIKVNWSYYANHGLERMAERGVTKKMIEAIIKNGKVLSQNGGNKFAYITKNVVVVVSKDGKLITAWGKAEFDANMIKIVKRLFGK